MWHFSIDGESLKREGRSERRREGSRNFDLFFFCVENVPSKERSRGKGFKNN